MNRINKGQKYVMRDCTRKQMIASSDNINIVLKKAEEYSKYNKNKTIYGFSVYERTGGGRCSEKLIKTFFKES